MAIFTYYAFIRLPIIMRLFCDALIHTMRHVNAGLPSSMKYVHLSLPRLYNSLILT